MTTATSITLIRQLFAHAAWANDAVLAGLTATPGEDAHALEQFAHVLAAEHVWLQRVRSAPQQLAVWPMLTLEECGRTARDNAEGYAALLAAETDESLTREITYTNTAGRTFTNRLVDILMHVGLHGSYHRGMVSLLTRRSGGIPVPTDFIAFVRGVPTATRSDAVRLPNP
jgi:uncharacterized damage-inducible protein DinB